MTKIFFAVAALFMLACSSDSSSSSGAGETKWGEEGLVVGSWELTSFNDATNEAKPRVYIALNDNGTFDLYQQFKSVEWVHYKGTYTFDGTLLSGEYQDGKAWGAAYSVEFAVNPARMRLTRSNGTDISIYTAIEEIPEAVVDETGVIAFDQFESNDTKATRSVEDDRFL